MKMLVKDSKPDEGASDTIEMSAVDARHAVAVEPDRYSIVEQRPVIPARTHEERITALEARVAKLEPQPVSAPDEPQSDRVETEF